MTPTFPPGLNSYSLTHRNSLEYAPHADYLAPNSRSEPPSPLHTPLSSSTSIFSQPNPSIHPSLKFVVLVATYPPPHLSLFATIFSRIPNRNPTPNSTLSQMYLSPAKLQITEAPSSLSAMYRFERLYQPLVLSSHPSILNQCGLLTT